MQKGMRDLSEADENVLYLDCTGGHTVYTFVKTHLNVPLNGALFLHKLYPDKVEKNKMQFQMKCNSRKPPMLRYGGEV